MDKENEPTYEAEDCGCLCNDDGYDSEWEWIPGDNHWECTGCGEVQ